MTLWGVLLREEGAARGGVATLASACVADRLCAIKNLRNCRQWQPNDNSYCTNQNTFSFSSLLHSLLSAPTRVATLLLLFLLLLLQCGTTDARAGNYNKLLNKLFIICSLNRCALCPGIFDELRLHSNVSHDNNKSFLNLLHTNMLVNTIM